MIPSLPVNMQSIHVLYTSQFQAPSANHSIPNHTPVRFSLHIAMPSLIHAHPNKHWQPLYIYPHNNIHPFSLSILHSLCTKKEFQHCHSFLWWGELYTIAIINIRLSSQKEKVVSFSVMHATLFKGTDCYT
ncbi:hypothetical protein FRX31_034038 [Thalictrum thalictroides]|uniref:Uncharacterized protein n=1 Tax=Thalictrum thalictroides TaxID=46969 RepID=A0A7J6UV79_THATH|nr:hypothetical protein FRX31_034038 [Thalictrum thalictroides]